jgi:phage repressor protein C with HTH and peptisase S24 domain
LAAASGIPYGTLQKIMQGKTDPGLSDLRALAQTMGVGIDWLITGMGPESGDGDDGDEEFVRVSLYDVHASAGPGAIAPAMEQPTAIKFRADWLTKRGANLNDLQAVRVRGDSMEPTLKNGDLIVIDTVRITPSDGIYVIAHDDEIQVKRLQRLSPTRLVVASDNPLAGNTEIDLRDATQHPRIIGRVIWLGRDL